MAVDHHLVECRARNCHVMARETEMVSASIVQADRSARGYYCDRCAATIMRVYGRL